MSAKLGILNIVLITGLAVGFTYGRRIEIMANWNARRCDPSVVVSAAMFKPDSDTRTPAEFASENFQFCRGKLARDALDVASAPLKGLQNAQQNVITQINDNVDASQTIQGKLAAFFAVLVESIRRRFLATYQDLSIRFQYLLSIMGKISASFLALGMSFIGVIVTTTTLLQISIIVIAIVISIIILIISLNFVLAAYLAPALPIVFGTAAAVIGIVAVMLITIVGVTAGVLCIAEDVLVRMKTGLCCISKVQVGETLEDGGRITAKMKFLVTPDKKENLVSVHGVTMSKTHMVDTAKGPIYAGDHPASQTVSPRNYLYNLNTTTRRIPVQSSAGSLSLLDYEEIAEDDVKTIHAWKQHVFSTLNPSAKEMTVNPENVEAGIRGDRLVEIEGRGLWQLSAIKCGDRIACQNGFTDVVGVVEIEVADTLHAGMTAGVWYRKSNGTWASAENLLVDVDQITESNTLYHLFTQSGTFVVNGYCVRDFSEVGLDRLATTYSMVSAGLSKN